MGKPKWGDLDPVLQSIYDEGPEAIGPFEACIKGGDTTERTALNLTSPGRPILDKVCTYQGRPESLAGHRVTFAVESDGRLIEIMSATLGLGIDGRSALNRLELIARQLQQGFELPYKPQIYLNGKVV